MPAATRFPPDVSRPGRRPPRVDQPHAITLDSRGRVFVGERSNGREHILEPDATFVAERRQFGRPGGMTT